MRAADRVAAAPDPDGGAADAARLRQTVRDVPRPLRRPPHHHQEEEGALQKGDTIRSLHGPLDMFLINYLLCFHHVPRKKCLITYKIQRFRSRP